ncbi:hypothetical protein NW795_24715, partial [Escherichia coli]|nr:hypothetical protein [Escherichia coli]
MPVTLRACSSTVQAQQVLGVLLQRGTQQVFRGGVVERQETAAAADGRAVHQETGAGLDQHDLDDTAIAPDPAEFLFVFPLLPVADPVVAPGETAVQQVVSAGGTRLAHRVVQAERRLGAAHQREILDETFEGLLGHHVRPRVPVARRHERALADVDEGVGLDPPVVAALAGAVIEHPGVAQVVVGAVGQVAGLHAGGQAAQEEHRQGDTE